MDIIITLPKEMWHKIVIGDKDVEMRKWCPITHFNLKTNFIYVVLKGTKKIVGYFNVVNFSGRLRKEPAWLEFGSRLGVSYEWFSKYWGEERSPMYFFEIGDCHVFGPHLQIEVPCAPQKYVNVTEHIKLMYNGFPI